MVWPYDWPGMETFLPPAYVGIPELEEAFYAGLVAGVIHTITDLNNIVLRQKTETRIPCPTHKNQLWVRIDLIHARMFQDPPSDEEPTLL